MAWNGKSQKPVAQAIGLVNKAKTTRKETLNKGDTE